VSVLNCTAGVGAWHVLTVGMTVTEAQLEREAARHAAAQVRGKREGGHTVGLSEGVCMCVCVGIVHSGRGS
jgi:hypothetical protein